MVSSSIFRMFLLSTVIAAVPLSAHAKDLATASVEQPTRMDLTAPQIGKLFSLAQINAILARAVDPELEHVEVEAQRVEDVPFRDRSATPGEAVLRTVANLLTPYPASVSGVVNAKADVTDSYRPAPVSISAYSPSFPVPMSQR